MQRKSMMNFESHINIFEILYRKNMGRIYLEICPFANIGSVKKIVFLEENASFLVRILI